MKKIVCIDIGGSAIKYGIIDELGNILDKKQQDTEAEEGGAAVLAKVISIIKDYQKTNGIDGVGISTTGFIDTEKGEVIYASYRMPQYAGTKFKKTIEEELNIPCEIENDVNCVGLAEYISGAAKGSQISLCLAIGTGIGGSIVINGEVLHGASNCACEVGYLRMRGSDFQELGSTASLCKRVSEQKRNLGDSVHNWDGKRIFEAAKQGDDVCNKAIDEVVDIWGQGIADICYVINPQVVVIGGGIMAQGEFLKPRIQNALERYLIPEIMVNTVLKIAKYENDAGMIGAFYHFAKKRKLELPYLL